VPVENRDKAALFIPFHKLNCQGERKGFSPFTALNVTMAKPDWQVVKDILERFQGQTNSVKALEIVKVLSRRIRQRRNKRKIPKRS
jgi:hypothetical protein